MHLQIEKTREAMINRVNRLFSGMFFAGKAVSLDSVYLEAHSVAMTTTIKPVIFTLSLLKPGRAVSLASLYLDAHAK